MNRGRVWIAAVVALLAGNAAAVLTLTAFAGDPSSRVEPDYYRRAASWDDTMAERRVSQALGWTADVGLIAGPAPRLEITLRDRAGAPLPGLEVRATVRPRSRLDHTRAVALDDAAGGRYAAAVVIDQPGLWVVEVEASRGAERFVATVVVQPAGAR